MNKITVSKTVTIGEKSVTTVAEVTVPQESLNPQLVRQAVVDLLLGIKVSEEVDPLKSDGSDS